MAFQSSHSQPYGRGLGKDSPIGETDIKGIVKRTTSESGGATYSNDRSRANPQLETVNADQLGSSRCRAADS